jgi:hypothetical protein
MSKDSYYFSHDYNARSDPKIKRLISKHGMMGYGLYWGIVEDLYNNANALPLQYDVIAFDMRTDENTIRSIINDFELFVIDGDEFGSLSVQRRLDQRDDKSEKARQSARKRWDEYNKSKKENANAMRTHSEGNAIKERKRKERKEIGSASCEIVKNAYHTHCANMPKVLLISDQRKTAINNRIKEHGIDAVENVIKLAGESAFLSGESDKGFTANLDWILKPANFIKIMEGNYKNKINGKPARPPSTIKDQDGNDIVNPAYKQWRKDNPHE